MSAASTVVVTGLGAATSLSLDVERLWAGVLAGASGIGKVAALAAARFAVTIGGEITQPCAPRARDADQQRRFDHNRTLRFALWAAERAVADAGLARAAGPPARRGVCLGVGVYPPLEDRLAATTRPLAPAEDDLIAALREAYVARPALLDQLEPADVLAAVAEAHGCRGPALAVQTACASGTQAIGHAMQLIRSGELDVVLAGGADSMMSALCVTGFDLLGALSRNPDSTRASRPFDARRDGFVMSEGAGVLVLESLAHAQAREAAVYAEVCGYGSSLDAWHFTDPHPAGSGAARAMRGALRSAGLAPADVAYVNAHGTSTPLNDAVETAAIRAVFGAHADALAVSSTKSQLGHLICAAGAVEALVCALALRDQVAPPTINLERPDPRCDLDYVADGARPLPIAHAMSNSFGFGGQNGTLIFRRHASPLARRRP